MVLLLVLLLRCASSAPTPPPAVFTAHALAGTPFTPASGFFAPFAYDAERGVQLSMSSVLGSVRAQTLMTFTADVLLLRVQGVCHVMPSSFKPGQGWFSWLPFAHAMGSTLVDGVPCALWQLNTTSGVMLSYATELSTGLPKLFASQHKGAVGSLRVVFRNVTAVASVTLDTSCAAPAWCPPQEPVMQTVPMVRLHSTKNDTLSNENAGDVRGDTMWVCANLVSSNNATLGAEYMTLYNVMVNTTWGQYQVTACAWWLCPCAHRHITKFCNYGSCLGAPSQAPNVGREAFAGMGSDLGGQCTANAVLGTWYSLTEAARAAGAWKLLQRVRTVSLSCLIGMGLTAACNQDNFPFDKAVALVQSALDGACPDVLH